MSKISGPLLDRIDIHVEVPAVEYRELRSGIEGESSASIRERIIATRHLKKHCTLDMPGETLLEQVMHELGSRRVLSFVSSPDSSAFRIMKRAARCFTEPPGWLPSSLARTRTFPFPFSAFRSSVGTIMSARKLQFNRKHRPECR